MALSCQADMFHIKKCKSNTSSKTSMLAAICLLSGAALGFLLGSMNTPLILDELMSGATTDAASAQLKSSNTTKYLPSSTMDNSMSRNHQLDLLEHEINRSIIDELIPERLRPRYNPQNLHFNITRSMLRKSRPIIGNVERLHLFLKKLRSQQCTTVLFLGGSVTAGHNAGGVWFAYPKLFIDWLNERYPCVDPNGSEGMHQNIMTHGVTSQEHFTSFSMITEYDSIDLVFIESNINDSFISRNPHALEEKGPIGETKEYKAMWYFEVLLRRLLKLRKPDPIAIVTWDADYIGRNWAKEPWAVPADQRKTLFRDNQEPLKVWLSSMYEIPVFSAVIWMLPLAGKKGLDWQFNRTNNVYSTGAWHADVCCHPKKGGHLLLNLILASCIVEEEKNMLLYNGSDASEGEHDFTMDNPPVLREMIYLSPEEENAYIVDNGDSFLIDFTEPRMRPSWQPLIVANDGWAWYPDNKDKDKFGFIATDVEGGSHISISVVGGHHGLVEVSYLISYENFGLSLVWIDNLVANANKKKCKTAVRKKNIDGLEPKAMVAIWEKQASLPTVDIVAKNVTKGSQVFLHICLTPHTNVFHKGDGNKFKLLRVRSF